jgi:alkylation response protein AidB-like acyl-CoA dehydrogenase
VPDAFRVGEVGQGWAVVRSNLEGERAAFGAEGGEPDAGEELLALWRRRSADPTVIDDPVLTDRVMSAAVRVQAARLTSTRAVHPSLIKVLSSESKQHAMEMAVDVLGVDGTGYAPDGYAMEQPTISGVMHGDPMERYLRGQGLTIEGGTSMVMRNVLADRALRLPREPRSDLGIPWREIPRSAEEYQRRVAAR